jgi:hypothetical protein
MGIVARINELSVDTDLAGRAERPFEQVSYTQGLSNGSRIGVTETDLLALATICFS